MKPIDWVFTQIPCHRIPARCLCISGYQMPLCARCFGILLGFAAISVLLTIGLDIELLTGVIFILIMVIDGSIQLFFKVMSNNRRRLVTGILSGVALGSFFWDGVRSLLSSFA